jgi:NAD(P)-dependent dehydrogenase (short-subunit alcohol dehydrogenase family)
MTFRDQVALVTGGASGIGRALCEELGRRGAIVVVSDLNEREAQAVADGIKAAGGRASATYLDVRHELGVRALIETTAEEHGRLDLLFNNAGIGVGGEMRELTMEHWRAVIDINLMGVVHGVAGAYPVMIRQKSGHIVNIASLSALIASPGLGPYATTKGAVVSLTLALRAEAEGYGVKVSAACPGFVMTNIFESAIGVRFETKDLLTRVGLPVISADEAARSILAGVSRNDGLIVFPRSARILWLLTRMSPAIMRPFQRRLVARLREVRRRAG